MLQPVAPQGIIYHVPHHPFRREHLGSNGDILLFDHTFIYIYDFIPLLSNKILIQPAYDFGFSSPTAVRYISDEPVYNAIPLKKILR